MMYSGIETEVWLGCPTQNYVATPAMMLYCQKILMDVSESQEVTNSLKYAQNDNDNKQ